MLQCHKVSNALRTSCCPVDQEMSGEKWKLGPSYMDVLVWYAAVVLQELVKSHSLPCSYRRDAIEVQQNVLSRRILLMMWTHPLTAPLPYKACKRQSSYHHYSFWQCCSHALPSPANRPVVSVPVKASKAGNAWALFTQGLTYWLNSNHPMPSRETCFQASDDSLLLQDYKDVCIR